MIIVVQVIFPSLPKLLCSQLFLFWTTNVLLQANQLLKPPTLTNSTSTNNTSRTRKKQHPQPTKAPIAHTQQTQHCCHRTCYQKTAIASCSRHQENHNLPPFVADLSYRHDNNNFQIEFVKKLTEYDVTKGFLMLLYGCGHICDCILIFWSAPYERCRIGGRCGNVLWMRAISTIVLESDLVHLLLETMILSMLPSIGVRVRLHKNVVGCKCLSFLVLCF